jgi:hypothetical protein
MITITNNNIYYNDFSVSTLLSLDKVETVNMEDIINFLSENVELGESVTFKRLFSIVSFNVEKFNDIFYSALGGYNLEPFLQEIENNPTQAIESEYLEIHWFCEKYENEFSLYPSLHGVSSKSSDVYAIDFVSLNNLKNYNIRINPKVEIIDYNKINSVESGSTETEELTESKLDLGDKYFTLFDLFFAIFHEISFYGGPQDKKEKFQELEDSIEKVENNLETIKEENKLFSFEEMLDKLDAEDIYLVKYKDLRDRVEEDRVKNKKKLSKLKNCLLEKLKIFDIIENSTDDLRPFYKKLTDIEYNMQLLYGEDENSSYHRFWETPKCTCPKIDNLELYPTTNSIFDYNCPIHGKIIEVK